MEIKSGNKRTRQTADAVAVMEIGSSALRMGIYQKTPNKISRFDLLEYPLRLGHEVFTEGRISAGSLRELSSAVKGYLQVMKEYGVTEYRAFATTALREASNRAYVVDQLHIRNGLVVEVLENGEESALIYSALLGTPLTADSALLSYIGTGSVGAAVCKNGTVIRDCHLELGFLKLGDMLGRLEDQTSRYDQVLEEYVDAYFQRIPLRPGEQKYHRLILTGRELSTIAELCGAKEKNGAYLLGRDRLSELYRQARLRRLTLPEETEGQLLPMLALYLKMMEFTEADEIIAPVLDILDIAASLMLAPEQKERFEAERAAGAMACARELAAVNRADASHAERVRTYAVQLFDRTKRLHGISGRRRLLLECAALLHELGNHVNARSAALATYDLIKQSSFYGLNEEEALLTAEIVYPGAATASLTAKQGLLTNKLSALLRLADALDESRRGKILELKLKLEEERLLITARGHEDLLLERWAVDECAPFVEEVYGVRPVFVEKSRLLKSEK
ncbi:MAG: hypothetical protein HFJ80_04930 [Clostridiales bacterium]|nr:hypothetical protein [Clostridiales bacterium]